MIDYTQFTELAGVYLEDSYVLAIVENPGELIFKLDAVLTPENPAYHPPRPGEHYCYARAVLVFPEVTSVEWMQRTGQNFTDAAGEQDLGNIDTIHADGDSFLVEGDWGQVRVFGSKPRFELDS